MEWNHRVYLYLNQVLYPTVNGMESSCLSIFESGYFIALSHQKVVGHIQYVKKKSNKKYLVLVTFHRINIIPENLLNSFR